MIRIQVSFLISRKCELHFNIRAGGAHNDGFRKVTQLIWLQPTQEEFPFATLTSSHRKGLHRKLLTKFSAHTSRNRLSESDYTPCIPQRI
ncbi:Hypothetical predicted protein [Podarcis lilfordi]|nr:Hypothetical predicted protein [Podarcis lilfordi]